MAESYEQIPLVVLLVGIAIVSATLIRAALKRLGLPTLVGHIFLGILLGVLDRRLGWLHPEGRQVLSFLAEVGVICLLFHVGLGSKVGRLLSELRHATPIWAGNVLVSGLAGYGVGQWLLGLEPISSLFLAIALTATSVGVAVAVWDEANLLDSRAGALLVDLAEMDDISAVVLMGVLLTLLPHLQTRPDSALAGVLAGAVAMALLKIALFAGGCLVISRFFEQRITSLLADGEREHPTLLLVLGIGFILASVAGLLGFSVAIGAFFAGLVFSRDPAAIRVDAAFQDIYDLFVPFFFINIGLHFEPTAMLGSVGVGAVVLVAAVIGKIVGTAGPAVFTESRSASLMLGVSMVPRAEIALLIVERGVTMGPAVVSPELFGGLVLTSAATTLLTPVALRALMRPQAM